MSEFSVWQDEPNMFGEPVYVDAFGQHYSGYKEYDSNLDDDWYIPEVVDFGSVAGNVFRQQSQYASRYLGTWPDYPNLAQGLRLAGDPNDYHHVGIHFMDLPTLFKRLGAYRCAVGYVYDYDLDANRTSTSREQEWGAMLLAGKPLFLQVE